MCGRLERLFHYKESSCAGRNELTKENRRDDLLIKHICTCRNKHLFIALFTLSGLWKEAIAPLIDSIHSFTVINDSKGSSYSFGLISRCLRKLGQEDYVDLQVCQLFFFLTRC